jgi:RNA polymerase sigma-70 factor (ECF subfamily)
VKPAVDPAVEAAFERVFRSLYPDALSYARRLVDDNPAEDAVQRVFVRLWRRVAERKLDILNADPEQLRAKILVGVRNETRSIHRSAKRLRKRVESLTQDLVDTGRAWVEAEQPRERKQLSDLVAEAVDRLPDRCRETYMLVRFQNLTYAKAASALGITVPTVHQHIVKGNRLVRAYLAPYVIRNSSGWVDELIELPPMDRTRENE